MWNRTSTCRLSCCPFPLVTKDGVVTEIGPPFFPVQPSREDEYTRIEAAGGKIIRWDWDGLRVCGVLAMSRSIGMCIKY